MTEIAQFGLKAISANVLKVKPKGSYGPNAIYLTHERTHLGSDLGLNAQQNHF